MFINFNISLLNIDILISKLKGSNMNTRFVGNMKTQYSNITGAPYPECLVIKQ